jgi:antitoxin ParD1/3/4
MYFTTEVFDAMTTPDISLPDSMREFIEQKVASGNYGTASEYIRQLVRADQKRAARERLEAILMEGLESGPSTEIAAEHRDELKRRIWQRHAESGNQ